MARRLRMLVLPMVDEVEPKPTPSAVVDAIGLRISRRWAELGYEYPAPAWLTDIVNEGYQQGYVDAKVESQGITVVDIAKALHASAGNVHLGHCRGPENHEERAVVMAVALGLRMPDDNT
jgi:hypothetical protein